MKSINLYFPDGRIEPSVILELQLPLLMFPFTKVVTELPQSSSQSSELSSAPLKVNAAMGLVFGFATTPVVDRSKLTLSTSPGAREVLLILTF
jgi:hypothetical protein